MRRSDPLEGPRILRARDLVRVPWKNGGGTTAEIAAYPPGAGFADFAWRISLADVAADGPFSCFPGIDRTLILGEGRDLILAVDGNTHRLAAPGEFLAFAGEAETTAWLGSGPIRDINVMSRRGFARHRALRYQAGLTPPDCLSDVGRGMDGVAVVALVDGMTVATPQGRFVLARFDAVLIESGDAGLEIDGDAVVIGLAVSAA